jgi:hypothetical protein
LNRHAVRQNKSVTILMCQQPDEAGLAFAYVPIPTPAKSLRRVGRPARIVGCGTRATLASGSRTSGGCFFGGTDTGKKA